MSRPPSELTRFILSLPPDLPTKAVVEQAQAKGHTTTESNVLRVRGIAKRGAGKKPAARKTAKKADAEQPSRPAITPPAPVAAPETPAPATPLSKSDFIRAQPASLNAGQVVAAGKAAGITFDAYLVYKVRTALREKTAGKKSAAAKAPTPKAAAKATAPRKTAAKKAGASPRSTLSPSDFVRSQPVHLSAAEVVANAKKVGITVQPGLVYQVRRVARRHAGPEAKPDAAPTPVAKRSATPSITPKQVRKPDAAPARVGSHAAPNTHSTSAEDLLRAVASELGLARAIGLLEEQRRQVLRVLGG